MRGRTGVALMALSAACFISVTSENLPVAMLPQLAAGLHVSGAAVGLLVTGYAIVVATTVVPLVALTARWDRRNTALITVATIVASNVLFALAPNYTVAVVARLVAAIGHGVFWSVVAAMAARMLGPDRAGRATTVIFAGNSLAFLAGLPLSSWLGATVGWRVAVIVIAGVAALAAVAIRLTLDPMPPEQEMPPRHDPHQPARDAHLPGRDAGQTGRSAIRRVVANRALLPVNIVTLVLVLGHFTAYTYITVIIANYVHLTGSATSTLLLAYGAAGLVGLIAIGRSVDARPRGTALLVTGGITACFAVLLVFGSVSGWVAGAAVVLWSVPAGGLAVILQAAVLRVAPGQRDLASAVYIVAFQIGIAGGAWLGGVYLDRGILVAAIATTAACGLVAAIVAARSAAFSVGGGREHSGRADRVRRVARHR
jgi:predicted MFS family arabinose efflux permease